MDGSSRIGLSFDMTVGVSRCESCSHDLVAMYTPVLGLIEIEMPHRLASTGERPSVSVSTANSPAFLICLIKASSCSTVLMHSYRPGSVGPFDTAGSK